MKTIRTPEKRAKFLAELAAGMSVGAACRSARISRTPAYAWRNDDAEFAAAWDSAIEEGTDELEDVLFKRASGADRPRRYSCSKLVAQTNTASASSTPAKTAARSRPRAK